MRETMSEKNANIFERKEKTFLLFLVEKRMWTKSEWSFLGERNCALSQSPLYPLENTSSSQIIDFTGYKLSI